MEASRRSILNAKTRNGSPRRSSGGSKQYQESYKTESGKQNWSERGNLSSNSKRDYQDNRSYGYTDHDDRELER